MIKQVQDTGKKKWYGKYLLDIQNESWKVMEGWLSQYSTACILSGCEVTVNAEDGTKYDIAPGIVFMKDAGGVYQYAAFAGVTKVALPGYIVLSTAPTNALYGDGNSKNVYITTSAAFQTGAPGVGVDNLHITNTTPTTWKDVVGISNPVAAPEAWRVVGAGGQPAFGTDFSAPTGSYWAKFRKDGLGIVEVNFNVQHAGSSANSTVFTLPSGYRPSLETMGFMFTTVGASIVIISTSGIINAGYNGGGSVANKQAYIIFRV